MQGFVQSDTPQGCRRSSPASAECRRSGARRAPSCFQRRRWRAAGRSAATAFGESAGGRVRAGAARAAVPSNTYGAPSSSNTRKAAARQRVSGRLAGSGRHRSRGQRSSRWVSRMRTQLRPGLVISNPAESAVGRPAAVVADRGARTADARRDVVCTDDGVRVRDRLMSGQRVQRCVALYAGSSRATSVRSAVLLFGAPGSGPSAWIDSAVAVASAVRTPARCRAP